MSDAHRQSAWSSELLSALVRGGISQVVVCPGSRHTPLVLAAHALATQGALEVQDILDERVAGFVALGLGRVTGRPAAVITTSGTAGAHLLPAVIEAERSRIPMIVMTADRPEELQGVGAPQTIDQRGLYGVHVRGSLEAQPLATDDGGGSGASVAGRALDLAMGDEPGPVHLNVPFRKPLWVEGSDDGDGSAPQRVAAEDAPLRASLDEATLAALVDALDKAERGLIYVGPGDPGNAHDTYGARRDAIAHGAIALGRALSWPVIADGGSAARLAPSEATVLTTLPSLVASGQLDAVHPDIILRVGQVATATSIQTWLASRTSRSIQIDGDGRWLDPARVSEAPLHADPGPTLAALADRVEDRPPSPWSRRWSNAESAARAALDGATDDGAPWSGAIVRAVLDRCPEGALLHVASSMPIRDLDAFSGAPNRRIHVAANRGANGIDGLVATSLGEALVWPGPVVALVGDLALAHDLGGLAAARQLLDDRRDVSLTVVVIDNGGGAIFDALPIARHPTAHEPHFIARQRLDCARVARGLDVETQVVEGSRQAVGDALARAVETPGLQLVHVTVDRHQDAALRQRAHEAVADALSGLSWAPNPWGSSP